MEERPLKEQIQHDLVVTEAARRLGKSGKYAMHVNAGEEHNSKFGGLFPDIIGTEKGSGKVRFIVEVETKSSIVLEEVRQWLGFKKLGVPFYLMVPETMLPIAQRLAAKEKIKCHWGTFHENEQREISIVYKKD